MRPIVFGGYAILGLLLAACHGHHAGRPPAPNIPPPVEPMPAGTLQFATADLRVAESQASVEVSITRTAGSHGAVSVTVSTVDGTATAGQDYSAVNTTITFADADTTTKTVTIPVLDDSIHEPDETFTVTLSNPAGGTTLGTQAAVSFTIEDNDPQPPPSAAQLALAVGTKQLLFNWPAVSGVTHYQLLANPDGASGFTPVGQNLDASATSAALDIAVHRQDWAHARYKLAACNATGCSDSNEVNALGSALQAIGAIGYFKASNTGSAVQFGDNLVLSADGTTLAVGANLEGSTATGINGNETDSGAVGAGAVYVFTRTDNGWSQQAYVKASNTEALDRFGYGLALSADGNTLAVGAYGEASAATGINGDETDNSTNGAGAVYVFTRTSNTWSQQAYVKASNPGASDGFGTALALSADGYTLAVSAPSEASAATGINGDEIDNSTNGAGAVYVFTRAGSTWSQQAYVKSSNPGQFDAFGTSLALSTDGDTLAVGASSEDSAASGIDGVETDNSANNSGAVYVFTRASSTWSQQAYVKAFNTDASDNFGFRVAFSADGNTLAVGAYAEASAATGINGDGTDNSTFYAGAVYVFTRASNTWSQQAYVKASNTGVQSTFGYGLALSADGNTLAVGAFGEASAATGINGDETDNSANHAGAVYIFTRAANTWSQRTYVKAPNTEAGDIFGRSLALSADGNTLAVGALDEDGGATGVNGDQTDNAVFNSGAVYLY
ncbi:MAG TPA: Calx-beta domain-containing protein [Steroidobacteraceae bacterium]